MFKIDRKIEIDAGHRIRSHGSKCRNLHGHRYSVHMTLSADELATHGSETGMVLDFSFAKDAMVQCIDELCDHALIVDAEDEYLLQVLDIHGPARDVRTSGVALPLTNGEGMKIYLVPFSPTAEALAKHWYELLSDKVATLGHGAAQVRVDTIRVYETPNCWAEYPAGNLGGAQHV
ncbi:6-pyruvoyl trahydropterin synthase family protein [Pseudomonas entomophila]|uniref:6-pyruvoyl trahydropterin synthase family protein n=1 Tax=Pseudomonas entomophila TaxID=312306 RepID=UPI00200D6BFB|nr:6-carboxytetrahydropterin synthase [Pseudomonas entomophila]